MSYLPSATVARINAQIATKEAQLAAANAAYTASLESSDTESYTLDTKEGKQSTTLRSPTVIKKQINELESDLDRLYRRLNGSGLVNMNLRRGQF